MYVIVDLEWIEKEGTGRSFTQLAMIRVNDNWEAEEDYYATIRPLNSSFYDWAHVAYTGNIPDDYLASPSARQVMDKAARWLREDDTLLVWHQSSALLLKGFCRDIGQPFLAVRSRLLTRMPPKKGQRVNPYCIASSRGIIVPGREHDAWNDAEVLRLLLKESGLTAQDLPLSPHELRRKYPLAHLPAAAPKAEAKHTPRQGPAAEYKYVADISSNKLHIKDCPHIPPNADLKAVQVLKQHVNSGIRPCRCVTREFYMAKRERNAEIFTGCGYNYLYSPSSAVFHRTGCKHIWGAAVIQGVGRYDHPNLSARRPCKICKPDEGHKWTPMPIFPKPAALAAKELPAASPKATPAQLNPAKRRAVSRHKQALEERISYMNSGALKKGGKNDLYTLTQPRFGFWAGKGCRTFHLRNCRKLSSASSLKGFSKCSEAEAHGYKPCKICKPSPQHDILLSMPIYCSPNPDESGEVLKTFCDKNGYLYSADGIMSTIQTSVGIWKINTSDRPYQPQHINLISTPDNFDRFHLQHRLFHSLEDICIYIKRHDEALIEVADAIAAR